MLTHATILALSLMVQPAEKPVAQPAAKPATPAPAPTGSDLLETPELTTLATGLKFAEGPQWRADGKLIFCDMRASTIYSLDPSDGKKERKPGDGLDVVRKATESAVGTAFDSKGLMVNAHFSGQVTRTEGDKVTVLAREVDGKLLNAPNDLTVRSDGTIYFSDFGKGNDDKHAPTFGVYRIDPAGKVTLESKDVSQPNGVALSPDEKKLYVGLYSKAQLMVFDVGSDGKLSGGRVFAELNDKEPKGRSAPDGVRTDMAGNVWTTGAGGIWVYDASGKRLGTIAAPGASNFCFGGADSKTLFITAGDKVMSAKLKTPALAGKK